MYRNLCNDEIYKAFKDTTSLKDESFRPQVKSRADREVADRLSALLGAVFKVDGPQRRTPHKVATIIIEDFKDYDAFLVADLAPCYDIDLKMLDQILRERVSDERLIRLVHKFIRAGFLSFDKDKTFSKTLTGNALAETLMEIYFNPLRDFLINQGINRYSNVGSQEDKINESFSRYSYVRYRNSLVLGLNFKDSERAERALRAFLDETYPIVQEVPIKKSYGKFYFLEYEFKVKDNRVHLRVPQGKLREIVLKKDMVFDINKTPWRAKRRSYLLNLPDLKILKIYNSELKSLYTYYRMCENVSQKLGELKHIMETSCLKTLASKHRTTVSRIKAKHKLGESWGIVSEDGRATEFYKGFKRVKRAVKSESLDLKPGLYRDKF